MRTCAGDDIDFGSPTKCCQPNVSFSHKLNVIKVKVSKINCTALFFASFLSLFFFFFPWEPNGQLNVYEFDGVISLSQIAFSKCSPH